MDDGLGVQVAEEENGFRPAEGALSPEGAGGGGGGGGGRGGHSLHALSRLPGDVDQLDHLELGLDDVQVVVEAGAFAPLGDNGQLRLGGVAHEKQDVDVAGLPVASAHVTKEKTPPSPMLAYSRYST